MTFFHEIFRSLDLEKKVVNLIFSQVDVFKKHCFKLRLAPNIAVSNKCRGKTKKSDIHGNGFGCQKKTLRTRPLFTE